MIHLLAAATLMPWHDEPNTYRDQFRMMHQDHGYNEVPSSVPQDHMDESPV